MRTTVQNFIKALILMGIVLSCLSSCVSSHTPTSNSLHISKAKKRGDYLNKQARKRNQIREYLSAQAKLNRNF